MAVKGGPIAPVSTYPVHSVHVFAYVYQGDGTTEDRMQMMGVADGTTLDGIGTWHLVWLLPTELPTGTMKLLLLSRADAVTGNVQVKPKWANVVPNNTTTGDPSSATLDDEGTQTITWTTNEDDIYKQTKVTLDANTVNAGEVIHMDLEFQSATTLSVDSGHLAFLIWE